MGARPYFVWYVWFLRKNGLTSQEYLMEKEQLVFIKSRLENMEEKVMVSFQDLLFLIRIRKSLIGSLIFWEAIQDSIEKLILKIKHVLSGK